MRAARPAGSNFAGLFLTLAFVLEPLASPAWAGGRKPTAEELEGWPAAVKDHVPVAAGEHPRLFFRKTDVPKLREKAATPEGQAMIKRLRVQLNGSDGEGLPVKFSAKGPINKDGSGPLAEAPVGEVFTYAHPAGYGLLYLLTGEKQYAELGKQAMEKSLDGYRHRAITSSTCQQTGSDLCR